MIIKVIFYCEACGTELEENAEVCSYCGTSVPQLLSESESITEKVSETEKGPEIPKCKYCGANLKEKGKFCTKCGKPISRHLKECHWCGTKLEN